MKTRNLILFVLTAVVCGAFLCADSYAKVCFLGEDCGSGGNFGNHKDMNPESECMKLNPNYWKKDKCNNEVGMYMPEYCPFSSKYGICCSLENKHSTCIYPLEKSGNACGGKYKCVCDRGTYKYTVDECKKIDGSAGENKAIPGGAACAEEVLNSDGNGFDIDTYYTECRCDRALYPYTPDMCDKNTTVPQDGVCTAIDANGKKSMYYASCYCDRKKYKYTSADCYPFVGDESGLQCSSGGATYYESCKRCDGYPARNLDHVGYKNNKPAEDAYDVCPYAQTTGYYKILRCDDPGYRPSTAKDKKSNGESYKEGEACVPIDCDVAIKNYLKANSTANSSYALFDGTNLVDGNGSKVTTKKIAVVAKDMSIGNGSCSTKVTQAATYETQYTGCSCVKNTTGTGNQQVTAQRCINRLEYNNGICQSGYTYCCTGSTRVKVTDEKYGYVHGGLKCVPATTYFSGAFFAKSKVNNSTDVGIAVKVACTKDPTITYTGNSFPYSISSGYTNSDVSGSDYTLDFYNVGFKFNNSNTVTNNRTMRFFNSKIRVHNYQKLTLNGTVLLNMTSDESNSNYSSANPDDSYFIIAGGYLDVKGILKAYKYSFNPEGVDGDWKDYGYMNLIVSDSQKNTEKARFTFGQGQEFGVGILDMYPTSTSSNSYNSSISVVGPTSGDLASVNTLLILGADWNGNYFGHGFHVYMSGGVSWNLYDNGTSRYVYLTSGSNIVSNDYKTGNYARIRRGVDTFWRQCNMKSSWSVRRYRGGDCDKEDGTDTKSGSVACSITMDGSTTAWWPRSFINIVRVNLCTKDKNEKDVPQGWWSGCRYHHSVDGAWNSGYLISCGE